MSDESVEPHWTSTSTVRRGNRSTIAPPTRPDPMTPTARIAPFSPRRTGEPVISYRSQALVVVSTHSPQAEI